MYVMGKVFEQLPFIRHYLESPCWFLFNHLDIFFEIWQVLLHYAEYNTDIEINLFVFSNPLKKIPNVLICLETTGYFTLPFRNVPGSTLFEKTKLNDGWKFQTGFKFGGIFWLEINKFWWKNYNYWHIIWKFQSNHNSGGLWKNNIYLKIRPVCRLTKLYRRKLRSKN